MRRLALLSAVLLLLDTIAFAVGYGTCGETSCSPTHTSFNTVAAYAGLALLVITLVLLGVTLLTLDSRRSSLDD
jgi:hypothetical protein